MLSDALTYDVRHAIRVVTKQRAVAVVVFVTLALGIGANTAIFSLVDAVLLRPLPYPHADRIIALWERRPAGQRSAMSTLNYLDFAQASSIFESVAATTGCCGNVTLGEGPAALLLGPARVSPVVTDVKTVDELKSDAMLADQLRSALVGLLATVALLLSAIGIYGVITQMVVQRRHELGIRAAVGASASRLLVLVLRDGMALTLMGVAVGMAASRGTGRLVATFLYGVSGTDWSVSLVSVCTLTVVATIACYLPARQATQIDPMAALRNE